MANFIQDWPTKELAKSCLKNQYTYCKKKGYDQTNFGMVAAAAPGDNEGDGDEGGPGDEEDDGDKEAEVDNKDGR